MIALVRLALQGVIVVGGLHGIGHLADKTGEGVKDASKGALYIALAFALLLFINSNKGLLK